MFITVSNMGTKIVKEEASGDGLQRPGNAQSSTFQIIARTFGSSCPAARPRLTSRRLEPRHTF